MVIASLRVTILLLVRRPPVGDADLAAFPISAGGDEAGQKAVRKTRARAR